MNVEIGAEAPIFLFWKYLFQIFGILSLRCSQLSQNAYETPKYMNYGRYIYVSKTNAQNTKKLKNGGLHFFKVAKNAIYVLWAPRPACGT
jgi:hypothetical protein